AAQAPRCPTEWSAGKPVTPGAGTQPQGPGAARPPPPGPAPGRLRSAARPRARRREGRGRCRPPGADRVGRERARGRPRRLPHRRHPTAAWPGVSGAPQSSARGRVDASAAGALPRDRNVLPDPSRPVVASGSGAAAADRCHPREDGVPGAEPGRPHSEPREGRCPSLSAGGARTPVGPGVRARFRSPSRERKSGPFSSLCRLRKDQRTPLTFKECEIALLCLATPETRSPQRPQLNAQLEGWLSQVQSTKRPARAIIAPHAGYTYCGSCAAHAYKQVDPSITRRIFILGPSHHVPLSRCALSSVDIYRTPLYDLRIDQKIYGELWKTGMFERMSLQTDEDEHSIEMHLPYTAKAMESHKDEFTIIPVLVGALSESKEQEFGKLFSKYLADPSNLFVVSSDFCHWGQRFRYSYYDESQGEIYRSIEHLDKMGMSIIEQLDPVSFSNYLKKYHNTICGRHPIGVLLNAITELQKNGMNMSFSFLNYAQSSQCRNWQDSSVSYAAGALTVH
ncbi:LOW QUALITY PROTEIN: Protein MEMO1, partial [Galemys pyrenaicus]